MPKAEEGAREEKDSLRKGVAKDSSRPAATTRVACVAASCSSP